ncbi:uncharacterized protein PG986_004455 [Apiospora aurea]|uniref:Uncharacterized protein n=1 Tax=Apiospora aurea TaxID=335848 RepID=A0ABR1QMM7_9PEZI
MLGLSIGVSNVGEALPGPVYFLLSGLNTAAVGIIALAAVQLSNRTFKDKLTRIIVLLTAPTGMLYNAAWYFPVLVFSAGCATIVHDYRWVHRPVRAAQRWLMPGTGTEDQLRDANDMEERASRVTTPAILLRPPHAEAGGLPFHRDTTAAASRRTVSNDGQAYSANQTDYERRVGPQSID